MKRAPKAPWLLACALMACADNPAIDLPPATERSPATGDDDGETRVAACDQAPDGTSCGLEMHCIFNACVENACGDGFVGGREACDDENERDHDGCNARCELEVEPGCGNGVKEPGEACDDKAGAQSLFCTTTCTRIRCGDAIVSAGETCDDGNLSDGDGCTSQCREPLERCGDGKMQSGEQCDDGNATSHDGCEADCTWSTESPMDGGTAAEDASSGSDDDAGTVVVVPEDAGPEPSEDAGPVGPPFGAAHEKPECAACRNDVCTVYQGVFDLVAKCFHDADPAFVQQCVDVLDCAYENKCGYGSTGAPECFCGSVDLNTCQTPGKANGPCQDEFYAAARTSSLAELIGRFGDVSLPVGVAYYFVECDRDNCKSCVP